MKKCWVVTFEFMSGSTHCFSVSQLAYKNKEDAIRFIDSRYAGGDGTSSVWVNEFTRVVVSEGNSTTYTIKEVSIKE